MGIMDRLSRLVRANVNDMLDRAENPELMLDQILRDMEVNIQQARGQVASMIAQEKELQADLKEVRDLSGEWQAKATRAVEASKDDLAREALRRKKDNEESAALYEQQLTAQSQTLQRMKSQLAALESVDIEPARHPDRPSTPGQGDTESRRYHFHILAKRPNR
jgi:phage shock protein A